jgi:hypothetical protein
MKPILVQIIICLLSFLYCQSTLNAQTIPPPFINYQAVLYDVNGANPNNPLTNQSFSTFVNINDELGNLLYREEHYASTDANGLITVKMGDGLYTAGPITNFNQINWGVGKYYLVVDFDINGTISSTAPEQLVTVPYSFYAGKAGNGMTAVADNGNGTLTFTYANGATYTTPTLSGIQGPAGPVGPSGASGTAGAAGQSAYDLWLGQGNTGTVQDFLSTSAYQIWLAQGNTGTAQDFLNTLVGPQGPQGVQGATGPSGATGLTGPAGAQGLPGTNGNDGADGAVGAQGPQGIQGPIGITGAQGPQGPIGLTGPTGPNGRSAYEIALLNGFVGTETQWLLSLIGATGPQGNQGPAGVDGAIGPQGIQGPAGNDGAIGLQGPIGLTGSAGPQGPIGLTGATGPQGLQGPAGNDGSAGPQGPIGLTGATGAQGPTGANGVGIVSTVSNNNGTVTFTYSDGTSSSIAFGAAGTSGNGFSGNQSLSSFMQGVSVNIDRLKVDTLGRLNLIGRFSGTVTFYDTTLISVGNNNVFLMQISPQNTLNWVRILGTTTYNTADLAIDTLNNLYCAFSSSLQKINSSGILVWSKSYTRAHGVEIDYAQNVICLYGLNTNFQLVKVSNSGSVMWNISLGSSNTANTLGDLCLNSNGDAFTMYNATFQCSPTSNTITINKINGANGIVIWTKASLTNNVGTPSCGSENAASAICTDNSGNLHVLTSYSGGSGNTGSVQISGVVGDIIISSTGVVTNNGVDAGAAVSDPICKANSDEVYYVENYFWGTANSQYYKNLHKRTLTNDTWNVYATGGTNGSNQAIIDFDKNGSLYLVVGNPNAQSLNNYSPAASNSFVNLIPGNSGIQILVFTP